MDMWLERPVWMVRYWLSRWLLSAALAACPSGAYSKELRRRVYGLRDEAVASVIENRKAAN